MDICINHLYNRQVKKNILQDIFYKLEHFDHETFLCFDVNCCGTVLVVCSKTHLYFFHVLTGTLLMDYCYYDEEKKKKNSININDDNLNAKICDENNDSGYDKKNDKDNENINHNFNNNDDSSKVLVGHDILVSNGLKNENDNTNINLKLIENENYTADAKNINIDYKNNTNYDIIDNDKNEFVQNNLLENNACLKDNHLKLNNKRKGTLSKGNKLRKVKKRSKYSQRYTNKNIENMNNLKNKNNEVNSKKYVEDNFLDENKYIRKIQFIKNDKFILCLTKRYMYIYQIFKFPITRIIYIDLLYLCIGIETIISDNLFFPCFFSEYFYFLYKKNENKHGDINNKLNDDAELVTILEKKVNKSNEDLKHSKTPEETKNAKEFKENCMDHLDHLYLFKNYYDLYMSLNFKRNRNFEICEIKFINLKKKIYIDHKKKKKYIYVIDLILCIKEQIPYMSRIYVKEKREQIDESNKEYMNEYIVDINQTFPLISIEQMNSTFQENVKEKCFNTKKDILYSKNKKKTKKKNSKDNTKNPIISKKYFNQNQMEQIEASHLDNSSNALPNENDKNLEKAGCINENGYFSNEQKGEMEVPEDVKGIEEMKGIQKIQNIKKGNYEKKYEIRNENTYKVFDEREKGNYEEKRDEYCDEKKEKKYEEREEEKYDRTSIEQNDKNNNERNYEEFFYLNKFYKNYEINQKYTKKLLNAYFPVCLYKKKCKKRVKELPTILNVYDNLDNLLKQIFVNKKNDEQEESSIFKKENGYFVFDYSEKKNYNSFIFPKDLLKNINTFKNLNKYVNVDKNKHYMYVGTHSYAFAFELYYIENDRVSIEKSENKRIKNVIESNCVYKKIEVITEEIYNTYNIFFKNNEKNIYNKKIKLKFLFKIYLGVATPLEIIIREKGNILCVRTLEKTFLFRINYKYNFCYNLCNTNGGFFPLDENNLKETCKDSTIIQTHKSDSCKLLDHENLNNSSKKMKDRKIYTYSYIDNIFLYYTIHNPIQKEINELCYFSEDIYQSYLLVITLRSGIYTLYIYNLKHMDIQNAVKINISAYKGFKQIKWIKCYDMLITLSNIGGYMLILKNKYLNNWSFFISDFELIDSNIEVIEEDNEFDRIENIQPKHKNIDDNIWKYIIIYLNLFIKNKIYIEQLIHPSSLFPILYTGYYKSSLRYYFYEYFYDVNNENKKNYNFGEFQIKKKKKKNCHKISKIRENLDSYLNIKLKNKKDVYSNLQIKDNSNCVQLLTNSLSHYLYYKNIINFSI